MEEKKARRKTWSYHAPLGLAHALKVVGAIVIVSALYTFANIPADSGYAQTANCPVTHPIVFGSVSGLLEAGPLLTPQGATGMNIWIAPMNAAAQNMYLVYRQVGAGEEWWYPEEWALFPAVTNNQSTVLSLSGLEPNTAYEYEIVIDGYRAMGNDGTFTTPPTGAFSGRISLGSCSNTNLYTSQQIWSRIAEGSPDLFINTGDHHYANSVIPTTILNTAIEQRAVPEFQAAMRNIPIFGIWDDHDYGMNDGNGTMVGKEVALDTFKQLWPNPGAGQVTDPGIYFKTSHGDVDFFFLDTRYNRSPDSDLDTADKHMLSLAQWEWLEHEVTHSSARFKFIVSGSTIWASQHDGWSLYSTDRARLLALTKTIPGIIFLTGDLHTSYVERRSFVSAVAGYPVYDIISSGLAVNTNDGYKYYTDLDIDTTLPDPQITVTVRRYTDTGLEEPKTPNVASDPVNSRELYYHTRTILLSELQPVSQSPSINYVLHTDTSLNPGSGFDTVDSPVLDATNQMTIMGWFRVNTSPLASTILVRRYGSAPNRIFRLDLSSSGELVGLINGPSSGRSSVGAGIVPGTWFFGGFTYDGTRPTSNQRIEFYRGMNGIFAQLAKTGASTVSTSLWNGSIGLRIGVSQSVDFDQVAYFTVAKSQADWQRMYDDWISGVDRDWTDEPGIVGLWPMEESFTDVINGLTGTRANVPTYLQADVP